MNHSDVIVDRPAGTIISKRSNRQYVMYVEKKVYLKDKKYNQDKRVVIGRLLENDKMIPNDKFFELFPDQVVIDKDPPMFADTIHVGGYAVIKEALRKTDLDTIIRSIYEDQADLIEDLIAYFIISGDSVAQAVPFFLREHPSFAGKVTSDTAAGRLMHNLSDTSIRLFNQAWCTLHTNLENVYVGYDSTNMNTAAQGIEIAEFGHAKRDEGLPQVNLSYVISQEDGTPLMYELYHGSVNDMEEMSPLIDKVKDAGFKNIGFILDRGYFVKKDLKKLDELGYEYIAMVWKGTDSIKNEFEDKYRLLKTDNSLYIPDHELYGITSQIKLFADDKKDKYLHTYYDSCRAESMRKEFNRLISEQERELEEKMNSGKFYTRNQTMKYKKWFHLHYDDVGYLQKYSRKNADINKYASTLGYFQIVTTKRMSASEALDAYRKRDSIEKVFMAIKNGMGFDTVRVHSDESLIGKTHILFMASIVRTYISNKIRELMMKTNDRKTYTVPNVINELEQINATRNAKGKYMRKYALTAKQKKMLKSLELDEKHIDTYISQINQQI